MILISAKLPTKGQVVFLPATIGGAHTNTANLSHTDVYTDTFPDGVTINMTIDDFISAWQTALFFEEHEIEFTPEEMPDVQH
jgi:hypothetical protein